MRPSRYLIALAAIFIVLFGVVLGFGSGSFSERLKPKLGLDLIGGTQLTLVATSLDGSKPSAENLELARQIIENRVNGLGVAEAEVVTEGDDQIVISAPGNDNNTLQQVGTPAQLRFRKALNSVTDTGATPPSPSPSASASPSTSASPGATPSGSASASPGTSASPKASASASSSPSPSATPSASATTAPAASPSASANGPTQSERLAAAQKKLGPAYALAQSIVQSLGADVSAVTADQLGQISNDPSTMAGLKKFSDLTPDEVSVLPPLMQWVIPQITCDKLNRRPAGSIVEVNKQATACPAEGGQKYFLDVAKVEGTDISSATANLDSNGVGSWKVDLNFNSAGATKWTSVTRDAFTGTGCAASVQQAKTSGSGQTCEVAVVLDNTVVSAPAIQGVLSTQSSITGGFNQDSATLLATQLKYGALPLTFDPGDSQQVSATLGTDYLKAGLLAAGIGMLLVVVYAFFYYRLLGSVITLSLVLSALLTFGMLVLLGRQIGFTLSLAGIAGFIVSLGVAADSFVIYFERLKDEIREGRSPRSAVPRAWHRARRTIITANVVTVLAAVVLYIVGVSSVKGFAFALGMATILDLVIVFLFRHPMMTMLARSPAFLSPRVSGLGRVLQHAREDTPPSTGTTPRRPKEA
jgi:preprotein translocase subunit SecD